MEIKLDEREGILVTQMIGYFVMGRTENAPDESPILSMGDEVMTDDYVKLYDKLSEELSYQVVIDEGYEICAWFEEAKPPTLNDVTVKPVSPFFSTEGECFDWADTVRPPIRLHMWAHYGRGWMYAGSSNPDRHKWQWDGKGFSGPETDPQWQNRERGDAV